MLQFLLLLLSVLLLHIISIIITNFLLLFTALEIDSINVNNHILCMSPTLFIFSSPAPFTPSVKNIQRISNESYINKLKKYVEIGAAFPPLSQ